MTIRFDLDADLGSLDWESCQALIELTDLWHARARLRSRWLMRAALEALPDFHLSQLADHISESADTYANDWK